MRLLRNLSAAKNIGTILIGVAPSIYTPLHATSFEYSEDVVVNKFVNISKGTAQYLDGLSRNTLGSNLYLKYRFDIHYKKWITETQFMSNISSIINHSDFQSMIQIGNESLPIILEKIDMEPSTLVWALNIITGVKITNDNTITVSEACRKWVKWGRANNIL